MSTDGLLNVKVHVNLILNISMVGALWLYAMLFNNTVNNFWKTHLNHVKNFITHDVLHAPDTKTQPYSLWFWKNP